MCVWPVIILSSTQTRVESIFLSFDALNDNNKISCLLKATIIGQQPDHCVKQLLVGKSHECDSFWFSYSP